MGFWFGVAAVVSSLIVVPVGGFFILFYCFPHILVRLVLRYQAFSYGMAIKFIGNEENVYCYGEKNKPQPHKPTIVFLHGFTSSKDQWLSCYKRFPADIHMIALDLPGHGETSRPDEDGDLSFDRAVDLVDEFLGLVGLEGVKVHLVGSSLGGAIAGIYAAKYPHKVDRVSLVCPAMQTPVDTPLLLQVKRIASLPPEEVSYDDCVLLTKSVQDLKDMLFSVCFCKSAVQLHDQVFKGLLALRLPKLPYYLKLFRSLTTVNKLDHLERVAHEITVPSQIIWGKEDEILHASGADILKPKLPDCHYVDLIEECGHGIHIDRPGAMAKHILKFYWEGVTTKED